MNAYTDFANTPRLRQEIVEIIMQDGRTTNAHASDICARLDAAGFRIVPRLDRTSRAIEVDGQIPHMTQRLSKPST
jgi:predicted metal-dependent hydrolase